MKIYYAHFVGIYNTPQEIRDIDTLRVLFPLAEIYNPNSKEADENYKLKGICYFEDIVKDCDVLVFRGLPNGRIPAGVYTEIECALSNKIPVIELPCFTERKMSINDTRSYLREIGIR